MIRQILRYPTNTRPALWIVEHNGKRAVVKDYRVNGFVFRNIIGRFLIWREKKAYMKLRGIRGIPECYGSTGGLALMIQEVKGRIVEGLEHSMRLEEDFFLRLQKLLEFVHRRGVAHCDLKRAGNIMLGDDGNPYIIDWSSAIFKNEFGIYPLSLIYRRFLVDDLNGIIKLRLRHRPESVKPHELKRYYHRSPFEKTVRKVRDFFRDLLKRVA